MSHNMKLIYTSSYTSIFGRSVLQDCYFHSEIIKNNEKNVYELNHIFSRAANIMYLFLLYKAEQFAT